MFDPVMKSSSRRMRRCELCIIWCNSVGLALAAAGGKGHGGVGSKKKEKGEEKEEEGPTKRASLRGYGSICTASYRRRAR